MIIYKFKAQRSGFEFERKQSGVSKHSAESAGLNGECARYEASADERPVGQVVKTVASHAINIGSNPVRVTNFSHALLRSKKVLDKS